MSGHVCESGHLGGHVCSHVFTFGVLLTASCIICNEIDVIYVKVRSTYVPCTRILRNVHRAFVGHSIMMYSLLT